MDSDHKKDEEKIDVRAELSRLEQLIEDLKVQYEQYFVGVITSPPNKEHQEVKRMIRKLIRAPFKNQEMNYRLRTLEGRYHTYNTYWERVQRQRESGTYNRDIFKANFRQRFLFEDQKADTQGGKADAGMRALYKSYKSALEKQTGKKQEIDYKAFRKSLVQRVKDFKEKHGDKKVTFRVVVKEGKVKVVAKAKEE